jgi:hypothetical protein
MFLKEQWHKNQIEHLDKLVNFNLDTPKDFLDAYRGCKIEERVKLCEFYLHNLILPHPYNWNPNPYVWDVQLMFFASWLRHEYMREEEFKKYKEEELQTPLLIRFEEVRHGDIITNHHNICLDKYVAPGWTTKQREEMAHLDESLILLGEEVEESFHRR